MAPQDNKCGGSCSYIQICITISNSLILVCTAVGAGYSDDERYDFDACDLPTELDGKDCCLFIFFISK